MQFDWRKNILSLLCGLMPALALTTEKGLGRSAILLALIAMLLLAFGMQALKESIKPYYPIIIGYVAFFISVLAPVLFAHSSLGELDHPVRFLLALPVLLALHRFGVDQRCFWSGMTIGAIGAGVIGYQQHWLEGIDRAYGYTFTISFGNVGLLLAALLLPLWLQVRHWWLKAGLLLAIAMGLLCSIASGSRGGWLALLLVFPVGIAYSGWRYGRFKTLISALLVAAALLAAYWLPQTGIQQKIEMAQADIKEYRHGETFTSNGLRLVMWRAAFEIFQDNPLLGVGPDHINREFRQKIEQEHLDPGIAMFGQAHNEYMTALAGGGLISFIGLLLLFLLPLRWFYQALRRLPFDRHAPALSGVLLIVLFMGMSLTQGMLFSHALTATFLAFILPVFAVLTQQEIDRA